MLYDNRPRSPAFILIEAKGGSATNSASRDVGGTRVQQGRRDYAEDVVTQMMARAKKEGNKEMMKLLSVLRDAMEDGDFHYLEVSQKMQGDDLGAIVIRNYQ